MTGTMVVLQLVTPAPSADPLQRKNDGDRDAALHALYSVECAIRPGLVLAGWKYRWLHSAVFDKSLDQY